MFIWDEMSIFKEGTETSSPHSQNRRQVVIGFMAVVMILLVVAINYSYQIERIIKGYDDLIVHPITAYNSTNNIKLNIDIMQRIQFKMLPVASQLVLAESRAASKLSETIIIAEYEKILKVFEPVIVESSYQLFRDWLSSRRIIYESLEAGEIIPIKAFKGSENTLLFENLFKSIADLDARTEQKVEDYQLNSATIASSIKISTLVLMALAIIFLLLLMYGVWHSLFQQDKQRHRRQALIDEHILIAILDTKGRIDDVSSALCQFLDCWREELIGSHSKFFLDTSENSKLLEKNILNTITQGKEWSGEISYTRHDGEKVWADSSVFPNFDDDYKIIGYTNVLHDLTSKKQASVDKLTGLLNRRSYDEILRNQISIAVRNQLPICLAILDIDYFKRFNDFYGYPEGDIALKKLSLAIRESMHRPNDYVFRIGGEEFAIIISGLDLPKIKQFLNALLEQLSAMKIPNKNSSVSQFLTVSIGAVVLEGGFASERELYQAADHALYEAKTARNTVKVNGYMNDSSKET